VLKCKPNYRKLLYLFYIGQKFKISHTKNGENISPFSKKNMYLIKPVKEIRFPSFEDFQERKE